MNELPTTRRITVTLRRWPLRVSFGVRPTIVIDGRAEPAQWGTGTWLVAGDRPVEVAVFLFVIGMRVGRASGSVTVADSRVEYRAPLLPFLPGIIRVD